MFFISTHYIGRSTTNTNITSSDCVLNEAGCAVESDLCDPEDDNGSLDPNLLVGNDGSNGKGDGDNNSDVCVTKFDDCLVRASYVECIK